MSWFEEHGQMLLLILKAIFLNKVWFFLNVKDPQKIVYEYEGEFENTFKANDKTPTHFTYSRYTPLLFYIGNKAAK